MNADPQPHFHLSRSCKKLHEKCTKRAVVTKEGVIQSAKVDHSRAKVKIWGILNKSFGSSPEGAKNKSIFLSTLGKSAKALVEKCPLKIFFSTIVTIMLRFL